MLHFLKKIKPSWQLVVLIVFYAYLAFHTLGGSLGVLKWADYSDRSATLDAEITRLKTKREALELRASQLRSSNLDLDRLDEEARRTLNISGTNDIVIWLDETP